MNIHQPAHPEHAAGWTPERVDKLKALWTEGASASEIVQELGGGVSRNGVIGKAHRMKLQGRVPRAHPANRPKRRTNAQILADAKATRHAPAEKVHGNRGMQRVHLDAPVFEPLPEEPEEGVDVTRLLGILQLTEHTCKWPHGDPLLPGFGFCGRALGPDSKSPYCDEHDKRAYHRVL